MFAACRGRRVVLVPQGVANMEMVIDLLVQVHYKPNSIMGNVFITVRSNGLFVIPVN